MAVPAKRKKSKPTIKKRKRRTKKRSPYSFIVGIFLLSVVLLVSLIYYTVILFPDALSKNIKQDLINFYKPISKKDDGVLVMKLRSKPEIIKQKEIVEVIKGNYGVDIFFDDVKKDDAKNICRLTFFRGENRFNDISEVYLYWDKPNSVVIESDKPRTAKKSTLHSSVDDKTKKVQYKADVSAGEISSNTNGNKKEKNPGVQNIRKVEKKEIKKNTDKNNYKQKNTLSAKKTEKINVTKRDVRKKAKLVIVIDDAGYNYKTADLFYNSGLKLNYALIPGLDSSDAHYNKILATGNNFILHIPMEPEKGREYVEKNAILTDMSGENITNIVSSYFNRYPEAIGANNHMGSKAIKCEGVMRPVIDVMKSRDLIWLNSLTSTGSVCKKVALEKSAGYLERDVFLDNENTELYARAAMEKLIIIAKKRGYAVGIGHIQSGSLIKILKEYNSESERRGICFTDIKNLGL